MRYGFPDNLLPSYSGLRADQTGVSVWEFTEDIRGGTAAEALAQIKEKGYAAPYARSGKAVTAVGAGFSERERTISEWVRERIKKG